jgi:hypothetical protein
MKYRYQHSVVFLVVLPAIILLQAATLVLMILRMAGVTGMTVVRPTDVITAVVCLLGGTFSLFLLLLNYKITQTHLQLNLGFFDILGRKVKIKNILNVVSKKDEQKVYLSYTSGNLDPIIMQVCINFARTEEFVRTLKAINPSILYTEE